MQAAALAADDADPIAVRDRAMVELLYASGLRVSELAGCDMDDIDLSAGVVRVLGKGGKERVVPFGRPAGAALATLVASPERAERLLAVRALEQPDGPDCALLERLLSDADSGVRCAALAQDAGYDGVEIMGSEGYLLNEFIAERTNQRDDEWGGSYASRIRFPLEIVRRTREKVGQNFIIIFRLSMLDLVEGGSTLDEVIELAQQLEAAGTSILNTCLLYTSPSPRDRTRSRMPSSA